MSLKVSVRMPISSCDSTWIWWAKSPSATRLAPRVRARIGPTIVRESRNDSSTEITRPNTSASRIRPNSSELSSCTVPRPS